MNQRHHASLPTPDSPAHGGLFVAFEGGDGAGKSTQVAALGAHLRAAGRDVVLTREPGGTAAAEAIREVVLDPQYAGLDARSEALLFAAARGEHVSRLVLPALHRGAVVVSDRYLDSSVAYQGVARGLGRDVVEGLSLWATGGLIPDLTVVLDVDHQQGLARLGDRDRLEAEPDDFHALVRRAFLGLAVRAPYRYLVLDAAGSVPDLARVVAERVDRLLAERQVPAR